MKNLVLSATVALFAVGFLAPSVYAKTVPCEDSLKQLRDAEKTAKLGDADKAKVADLEQKGVARCTADDDVRADQFFEEAMKVVSKK